MALFWFAPVRPTGSPDEGGPVSGAVLPGFFQSVFVSSDAFYGLSSLKESDDVSQSRAE
jgi:hypothetical protein